MNTRRRLFILAFAGLGCIVLLGLLLLYVGYAGSQAVPTFPRITISSTFPETAGVVNQPVLVFGEASDPDGIGLAELWVNGQKVASQANPDPSPSTFDISQSFIPDGPGSYLFSLRGVDRKGFAAQSAPVMIEIADRSDQSNLGTRAEYIVQAGDTLDSIAAQLGTTPDEIRRLNPDVGDLVPGDSRGFHQRPRHRRVLVPSRLQRAGVPHLLLHGAAMNLHTLRLHRPLRLKEARPPNPHPRRRGPGFCRPPSTASSAPRLAPPRSATRRLCLRHRACTPA